MRFYSESGILEETEETDSKKIKVAIIDDDAVIRRLLQTAFGSINAECELFDSGAEFLVATNRKKYDLIILDIFMPGISGFDILINLHNKKYLTPVIVYSNATQREAVIQALSLGAKSYLIKPLKPEAILQKAVEVLQSKF
jgi:DNA-binding response OmpR family regulator